MEKPDFCINKNYIFHKKENEKTHWRLRFGYYKSKLKGTVQRFRCKNCGKTFSTQTYRLDYYEKRLCSKIRIYVDHYIRLSNNTVVL